MGHFARRGGHTSLLLVLFSALVLVVFAGCPKKGEGEGEGTGEAVVEGEAPAETPAEAPPEAPPQAAQTFTLAANFAPTTQNGRSGGTTDATTVFGEDCYGNIAGSPDHTFTVSEAVTAAFAVTSEADTTLVIAGPGGPYCNDDAIGLNPGLTLQLQPGDYQLFVGNYDTEAGATPYTLVVTPAIPTEIEIPVPQVPEGAVPAPAPPEIEVPVPQPPQEPANP